MGVKYFMLDFCLECFTWVKFKVAFSSLGLCTLKKKKKNQVELPVICSSKLKLRCSFNGGIHPLVLLEEANLLTKNQCWLCYPQTFQIFGFQCKSHWFWCTKCLFSGADSSCDNFSFSLEELQHSRFMGNKTCLITPHSQKLNCKWRKPKMQRRCWPRRKGLSKIAGILTSLGVWFLKC